MVNNYKMPSRVEIIDLRQRGAERQTAPWLPEEKTELERRFTERIKKDCKTAALPMPSFQTPILKELIPVEAYMIAVNGMTTRE